MGQVFEKLNGKQWRQKQIRKISDKVYDRVKSQSTSPGLTFEQLYIAVLLVYNDINKRLPGPHFDPPTKEEIRVMIQGCFQSRSIRYLWERFFRMDNDLNLDGQIDREEFVKFIQQLTADTFIIITQGLLIALVVAPTVAMATKRATEGVPGVGKVVQKLPNSVYASLVTLAVVLFQKSLEG